MKIIHTLTGISLGVLLSSCAVVAPPYAGGGYRDGGYVDQGYYSDSRPYSTGTFLVGSSYYGGGFPYGAPVGRYYTDGCGRFDRYQHSGWTTCHYSRDGNGNGLIDGRPISHYYAHANDNNGNGYLNGRPIHPGNGNNHNGGYYNHGHSGSFNTHQDRDRNHNGYADGCRVSSIIARPAPTPQPRGNSGDALSWKNIRSRNVREQPVQRQPQRRSEGKDKRDRNGNGMVNGRSI